MFIHLFITLAAFTSIWLGSSLAVSSVEKLSHRLHISSFAVSFVLLGLFTSMSELSVGINSLLVSDPEIFVGNLLGASLILILLLIPLLSLIGRSVTINKEFSGHNLPLALLVIGLPAILVFDGKLTQIDGYLLIGAFFFLVFSMQMKQSILEKIKNYSLSLKVSILKESVKTLAGVLLIFTASHYLVEQTLYYSNLYSLSPFLLSLLIISVGTNLPEISLIFRSAISGNTQVAFGDYLGSASFNTLLMGILTVVSNTSISLYNNYFISLIFLLTGLILFYFFARSKNTLSRLESLGLLVLYLFFLLFEIISH